MIQNTVEDISFLRKVDDKPNQTQFLEKMKEEESVLDQSKESRGRKKKDKENIDTKKKTKGDPKFIEGYIEQIHALYSDPKVAKSKNPPADEIKEIF